MRNIPWLQSRRATVLFSHHATKRLVPRQKGTGCFDELGREPIRRIQLARQDPPNTDGKRTTTSGVFRGVFWLPGTPPPIFIIRWVTPSLAPTYISHFNLRHLETPLIPCNSGYATDNRLEPDRFPGRSVPETLGATRRDDATTRMDDAASHIGDVSTHADDERTERMTLVTTLTTWEWWRQHPRTTNSRVPGERTAMTVPTKIRRATFEDVKTYKHTSIKHTKSQKA